MKKVEPRFGLVLELLLSNGDVQSDYLNVCT
jgi:hypothetical protein